MQKDDLITIIRNQSLPVIICGAGIVGEIILSVCREAQISVECFCDNSVKVAGSALCGLEVMHTSDIRTKYKDACFIISVAAIKDAVDRLHEYGFYKYYAGGILLKDMDISQTSPLLDYTKFAIQNCILCHDGYLDPTHIFIRSIDIIITERCSLRCKDCSNLMQYYECPQNCDTAMLLTSIDKFCAVVDDVMDFRVIGGETFMNKEWHVIVNRLVEEPKARRVVLYTNGTIVPNPDHMQYLKNDKVLVIISDYGSLSKRLPELKRIFAKNKIAHYVLDIDSWLDCSQIVPHNRTPDQNRELYKNCCAKNMGTLSDGKVFRCPYSANAARLAAVPDNKDDYIDLHEELLGGEPIGVARKKLRDFLLDKEYLETCDFCSGRPLSGTEVQPAVQLDRPVPYRRYDSKAANCVQPAR